jgi:hypothetical protein
MERRVKMKRMVYLISFFLTLIIALQTMGCKNDPSSQFEKKVKVFKKFFEKDPKLIYGEKNSKSPTGYIYSNSLYKLISTNYEVKAMESSTTPYIGYIYINYRRLKSDRCGDIRVKYIDPLGYLHWDYLAFLSATNAKNKIDHLSCYVPCPYYINAKASFIFYFQEGKWVFDRVVRDDGETDVFMSLALRKPYKDRPLLEENDHWKVLIE